MHGFSPFYVPFFFALAPLVILLAIWSIAIRGYALWTSARASQTWWFIFFVLPINTAGIIELVYLIWFAPPGSNKLSRIFDSHKTPAVESSSPQG